MKDATKDLHEPSYSQLSAEEFLRKAFFRPDVERVPGRVHVCIYIHTYVHKCILCQCMVHEVQ